MKKLRLPHKIKITTVSTRLKMGLWRSLLGQREEELVLKGLKVKIILS